jgi:hypothetical protein
MDVPSEHSFVEGKTKLSNARSIRKAVAQPAHDSMKLHGSPDATVIIASRTGTR